MGMGVGLLTRLRSLPTNFLHAAAKLWLPLLAALLTYSVWASSSQRIALVISPSFMRGS